MSDATARRLALWALAVIFAANFFSYLDRQLVSALEAPMSKAFGLTHEQFGLLWTLFTVGYMVFAMPIGYLADRYNRPRILAACIVVWSVATAASGWASELWLLKVSRFLIGVGEAGCLIIGQALLADLFESRVRGKALSVFHLAVPLGGTAAFIMAGALKMLDWRTLFYIAAAPGFLIAVLILALSDSPRGGGEPAPRRESKGGMKDYLQLFRIRTLMLVIFAQAFAVITLVPLIHFGVGFFALRLGLTPDKANLTMGLMALVAGGLGTFLSGVIGDRLSRKHPGGYALQAGISFLLALPCLGVGFTNTQPAVALGFLTAGAFFIFLCMPAVNTQIANVTPAAQRAMAWSLAVFILHLLGDTAAPWVFGKINDSLAKTLGSDVLARERTFLYFSSSLVLAGLCCLLAARSARGDVERAKNAEGLNPR